MTYGLEFESIGILSFIWVCFYKNKIRFHMKTLRCNLYSTKPKKYLNLYFGHRSSSGYGFFSYQINLSRKDNGVHYF